MSEICFYQTRHAFSRTMGCPFLQTNAFWNSGILDTTPFARAFAVAWGLDCAIMVKYWGVAFEHQVSAYAVKNSCCGVNPFEFVCDGCGESVLSRAIRAIRKPPLSAVFSPSVNFPFSFTPSVASNPEYSSAM